ncbi:MAG TPA: hypothetical protein VEC16_07255 [Alphaproteobacteria bacterium]|nr:hypothetical protein [Alphaproteobacteria bacterium]
MNKIYKEFYKNKLFTIDDAKKIIKNYQVLRNNLTRLHKQKLIKKLKGGLYYIAPLDNDDFQPDPIHVASRMKEDSIITGITALKVLQLTNQDSSVLYIVSKHQSKDRIDKYTYKIIKGQQSFGTTKAQYQTPYGTIELKITDIERTLIECIRTRSIKAIDLINIIRAKQPQVDPKKILTYLEKYNMGILYNKVGLLLEVCSSQLHLDPSDIDKIRKKLSKKIYYYKEPGLRLIRPRYFYNKEWNIMLPEQLHNLVQSLKPQVQ